MLEKETIFLRERERKRERERERKREREKEREREREREREKRREREREREREGVYEIDVLNIEHSSLGRWTQFHQNNVHLIIAHHIQYIALLTQQVTWCINYYFLPCGKDCHRFYVYT